MNLRAVTGLKPTGIPHIGNYLGMIQPALRLTQNYETFYFIADYHALISVKDPETLNQLCYIVAATWLACGLNPDTATFYRQSDIPEVFELNWILSCFTSKGLMNRAHAYKDAVAKNIAGERDTDEGINIGLYNYPILMSADILFCKANVVPVGKDNQQHVEMTRDIAQAFNTIYGQETFFLPEALI